MPGAWRSIGAEPRPFSRRHGLAAQSRLGRQARPLELLLDPPESCCGARLFREAFSQLGSETYEKTQPVLEVPRP